MWMQLKRGEPKRCYCGYWFEMGDVADPDYGHKFIEGDKKDTAKIC